MPPFLRSTIQEWIARYVNTHWAAILGAVGTSLMPRGGPPVPPALGCGVYGCVYRTGWPGLVLKATLDHSEGRVVARAIANEVFPPGIVKYTTLIEHDVDMSGTDIMSQSDGRQGTLFLIWREEAIFGSETLLRAYKVVKAIEPMRAVVRSLRNDLHQLMESDLIETVWSEFEYRINAEDDDERPVYTFNADDQRSSTQAVYEHAIGALLYLRQLFGGPAPLEDAAAIWDACGFYLQRGIVFSDLHKDNLGVVMRNGRKTLVITDPGGAIIFDD